MRELPSSVRPLVDFLNTVDVEEGTDVFAGGPAALAGWLVAQGLCEARPSVTAADVREAADLRRGLRALALANNGEEADPDDLRAAQDVLDRLSFRIRLPAGAGTARLEPAERGGSVSAALGRIAAAYVVAAARGEWPRVRRCPAHDCAWVFWDSSKNASRRWCTMRVCGNRAKARAFAERRAAGSG